jgi:hypothetical protein
MSRITIITVVFLFALAILAPSATHAGEKRPLSGNVSGVLDSGEYLVKSVLIVQAGDTLCIPAGTILYFGELSGIDVEGELRADGTLESPIVMTSVNAAAGSAEAAQGFDWNGVKTAGASAAIRLRHVDIGNSVYGVNIRDTLTKAEFAQVTFQNNGYASLVRGKEIIPITHGEPFSALWNIDTSTQGQQVAVRMPTAKRARINAKLVFNASALGMAAVGITVYSIGLSNNNTYFKHYSQDGNSKRLSAYYENEIRGSINVSTVGAVMAGIGLGCVGVSLFF